MMKERRKKLRVAISKKLDRKSGCLVRGAVLTIRNSGKL